MRCCSWLNPPLPFLFLFIPWTYPFLHVRPKSLSTTMDFSPYIMTPFLHRSNRNLQDSPTELKNSENNGDQKTNQHANQSINEENGSNNQGIDDQHDRAKQPLRKSDGSLKKLHVLLAPQQEVQPCSTEQSDKDRKANDTIVHISQNPKDKSNADKPEKDIQQEDQPRGKAPSPPEYLVGVVSHAHQQATDRHGKNSLNLYADAHLNNLPKNPRDRSPACPCSRYPISCTNPSIATSPVSRLKFFICKF